MTYPQAVRERLADLRRSGLPFELAWTRVMADCPPPPEWHQGEEAELRKFLRNHMKAAYNRDESKRGRFKAPAPEASPAVGSRTRPLKVKWCRSAEGCKHEAGFGRFGNFCASHANTLAHVYVETPEFRKKA